MQESNIPLLRRLSELFGVPRYRIEASRTPFKVLVDGSALTTEQQRLLDEDVARMTTLARKISQKYSN